jgi:hypothetical protein
MKQRRVVNAEEIYLCLLPRNMLCFRLAGWLNDPSPERFLEADGLQLCPASEW